MDNQQVYILGRWWERMAEVSLYAVEWFHRLCCVYVDEVDLQARQRDIQESLYIISPSLPLFPLCEWRQIQSLEKLESGIPIRPE